jgi:hypothetical protein
MLDQEAFKGNKDKSNGDEEDEDNDEWYATL